MKNFKYIIFVSILFINACGDNPSAYRNDLEYFAEFDPYAFKPIEKIDINQKTSYPYVAIKRDNKGYIDSVIFTISQNKIFETNFDRENNYYFTSKPIYAEEGKHFYVRDYYIDSTIYSYKFICPNQKYDEQCYLSTYSIQTRLYQSYFHFSEEKDTIYSNEITFPKFNLNIHKNSIDSYSNDTIEVIANVFMINSTFVNSDNVEVKSVKYFPPGIKNSINWMPYFSDQAEIVITSPTSVSDP